MIARRFSVDTPPVSGHAVLSGANFREVAPEVLSPLTFSLVGAGMEEAFRYLGDRVGVRVRVDSPQYLAYVAFRPFHVMSSMDVLVARVPVVQRSDLWGMLLGGRPPLVGEPRTPSAGPAKLWRGVRLLSVLAGNGDHAGRTNELVATAEDAVCRFVAGRSAMSAGVAFEASCRAAKHAWALHSRTTTVATAAASVLRRLFALDYDESTADELLRHAARRASEAEVASARPGRLKQEYERLSNYEVADASARFARWAVSTTGARPLDKPSLADRETGGEILPIPQATLAGRLAHRGVGVLDRLLAERERSKELGLRALHCVRMLLDHGATGLESGDAALLGAGELQRLAPAEQARLVAQRAEELEEAARIDVAVDLLEQGERLTPIERPATRFSGSCIGKPLAPGWAEARLVSEATGDGDEIICGERVDGNYVLAVLPAGVVTAHGSVLSHVAIVCRELGIPLVAGVHIPESEARGKVVVDGWTGLVSRTAAEGHR